MLWTNSKPGGGQGQLIEFDEATSEWSVATFSADIVGFQDHLVQLGDVQTKIEKCVWGGHYTAKNGIPYRSAL